MFQYFRDTFSLIKYDKIYHTSMSKYPEYWEDDINRYILGQFNNIPFLIIKINLHKVCRWSEFVVEVEVVKEMMKTIWSKFNIRWQLTHRNKTIKRKRSVIRLLKLLDLSQLHFRVTNAVLSHQNWFVHCNINCLVTAYVIHKTSFNATVKMHVIKQV